VDVKAVMSKVWDRRHFEYSEVDIHASENRKWRHLYEFDIPVVHVERSGMGDTLAAARKLKHRFTEGELEKVMDKVEAR
jgi:hypothetical protein